MSHRKTKGTIIAVLLICVKLIGKFQRQQDQTSERRREHQAAPDEHLTSSPHLGRINDQIGTFVEQQRAHHEEGKIGDQKNYALAKWALRLTATTAFLSALAAAATIGQAYYARKQLTEAREEQRAWIQDIGVDAVKVIFENHEVTGIFKVSIKNIGREPAVNVWAYGKIIPYLPGMDIAENERQVCQERFRPLQYKSAQGLTIFPDQQPTWQQVGGTISSKDADAAANLQFMGKQAGDIVIYLVGCLEYRYGGSGQFHHTPFINEIDQADAQTDSGWIHFKLTDRNFSQGQVAVLTNPVAIGETD